MLHRSCGSPSASFQWVTLKVARRKRVVNDWVETRISDWMVAMIGKTLGKRKSYMESHPQEHQLWNVSIWSKDGYRFRAVTNMSATFNKLCIFAFCIYTSRSSSACASGKVYILNRWSCICSHCPFDQTKKMFIFIIYRAYSRK